MEKNYWLGRNRASLTLARAACSAEARLIHYDLAGRYLLKAITPETEAIDLAGSIPPRLRAAGDPEPASVLEFAQGIA